MFINPAVCLMMTFGHTSKMVLQKIIQWELDAKFLISIWFQDMPMVSLTPFSLKEEIMMDKSSLWWEIHGVTITTMDHGLRKLHNGLMIIESKQDILMLTLVNFGFQLKTGEMTTLRFQYPTIMKTGKSWAMKEVITNGCNNGVNSVLGLKSMSKMIKILLSSVSNMIQDFSEMLLVTLKILHWLTNTKCSI